MKRHIGIVLFYVIFSFLLIAIFFRYKYSIDLFLMFTLGVMITGWILNLSPRTKIWFLFWSLIGGTGFCLYVHHASLDRSDSLSSYKYAYVMGFRYSKNISVRNYSINRKREIEKKKEAEKFRKQYYNSGSSYSGSSSHYGGGLSGGK